MKQNRALTLCIAGLSMMLLILDGRTALNSASSGISICIRAVIPSLFPFFFLSAIINDRLLGTNSKLLYPIARLCKIPPGSESILLLGLVGGYPVGAAGIYEAYKSGALPKSQAMRMLSFCNNAGPAFLFGMLAQIFDISAIWALWLIHILSALAVGILIPGDSGQDIKISHSPSLTPSKAMQIALRNMVLVCGWIILFRIILGFFERWFLWLFPQSIQVLLFGILELSNGCLSLSAISCDGLRFLYAAVFLSFGGVCVSMQTASAIGDLPFKSYIHGKLLQTAISVHLAGIMQAVLFPGNHLSLSVFLYSAAFFVLFVAVSKKAVAFRRIIGYNGRKSLSK